MIRFLEILIGYQNVVSKYQYRLGICQNMVPKPNIEISIPHLKFCRMIPLTLLIF